MTISNRTYLCVACGELRRLPLPPGLLQWVSEKERERRKLQLGMEWPKEVEAPVPYGHWRGRVVGKG
jgi:hypothetical protein